MTSTRLAKVILMILIVPFFFEQALNMKLTAPIDLLYLGGSIALIALALYLTHSTEHKGQEKKLEGERERGLLSVASRNNGN